VQFAFYGRVSIPGAATYYSRILRAMQSHSVAVSSFDAPCVALPPDGSPNNYFSGFMPTSEGDPFYTIQVLTTDPIWLFCSVGEHCQAGMVGVINP
jgi:hypothetical protein